MSAPAALSVLGALASAFVLCRRRCVWRLGRYGQALAPAFLLTLWFAFLSLGEMTHSLVLMGWLAGLAVGCAAGLAWRCSKPCRRVFFRWSLLDWSAFLLLVTYLVSFGGLDSICHTAVVSTYLRGNIPPCAFNDPSRPLMYHPLFDAAAALLVKAFGVDIEGGLHLVSVACLFAAVCALQAISRMLFNGRLAQNLARLFYLCGFGPVYLDLSRIGIPLRFFFHGQTTQSFAETLLRRPMALNHVVFLLLLAALIEDTVPMALLPCAMVLPRTSEELTILGLLLMAFLWLKGRWPSRWAGAWTGLLLAALLASGVFRAMASSSSSSLAPKIALAWPPSLPYWVDQEEGVPLGSLQGLAQLLFEWGPLFFAGLVISAWHPKRRAITAVFVFGFIAAIGFGLGPWPKADLDRFLFYGTCSGFMLQAGWLERMRRWSKTAALAGTIFLTLGTTLGPLGYVATFLWPKKPTAAIAKDMVGQLRRMEPLEAAFAAVGPREQVLTDVHNVQALVLGGLVVVAPMTTRFIGKVDIDGFDAYVKNHPHKPDWLFLPARDPRLKEQREIARFHGYVLAKAVR